MKQISFLFFIIALLLTGTGCKKWLDVQSKTDVVQKEMFNNEQGFFDAMAGVYYTMSSGNLYGDKLTMGLMDVIAGRYNIGANSFIYGQNSDYYEFTLGDPAYASTSYYYAGIIRPKIDNIWDSMYFAIANTNNILENIDAKKGLFSENNYNLLKGEALGLRAFMHFDLMRMFGPSYLAAKDSLAIPYIKEFTAKKITLFSTVKAATDSIIADLNAAAVLLENDNINTASVNNSWLNNRKCHFNYWAVQATLAKVYLYAGDKTNALIHAKKVIDGMQFRFITAAAVDNGSSSDYTFIPEQIFALAKYDLDPQTTAYFHNGSYNGLQLSNEQSNVELIYEASATDLRYLYLWGWDGNYYCTRFWQYSGGSNLVPLIRLPEMYYIAAECSDGDTRVGYLNTVRTSRNIPALAPGMSNEDLQTEIFKEYRKEFYCEGQLYYYYKRLNMAQVYDYDSNPFNTTPDYYQFPIPAKEIEIRQGSR